MLMSKGIKSKKHIAKITASSICSLLIFLCSLLISSCPNPLINDFVEPKKITFETNGGSHVSTQTIFKGQPISRPKDPTRSGYNFEGWYRDNGTFAAGWDFGAVPSGDMTLYACWSQVLSIGITLSGLDQPGKVIFSIPYNAPLPEKEITVTNTGDKPTGDLTIELSGNNPDKFAITPATINSLELPGNTDIFKITPNDNINIGVFSAICKVFNTDNGVIATFTITFSVGVIDNAAITMTSPVTYALPADTMTGGASNFSIGAVTWSPSDNPFLPGKQYTATVTLTASTNYMFTELSSATINGNIAAVLNNTETTVMLSYTFAATAAQGQFNTVGAIEAYLSAPHSGNSITNPVPLQISLNLGNMATSGSNWQELLNAIEDSGKFVELDLSGCSMTGTSFNPDNSIPAPNGKDKIISITLPNTATTITSSVSLTNPTFDNFDNLNSVSGANIDIIGEIAFTGCSNLAEVSFPSATYIGMYTFSDCTSMTEVSFPSAAIINHNAFRECTNLIEVNFPLANIIYENAFNGCTSLTEVTFPEVTSMESSAFRDCTGLVTANFPLSTNVGISAFSGCTNLVEVNFPVVTLIRTQAFLDCTSLTSVSFPMAESIADNAFRSCTNLTEVYSPLVESIGNYAFQFCASLTEVNFPAVTSIPISAFSYCTSLISANFPLVESIDDRAFFSCSALKEVTLGTIAEENFITTSGLPGDLRDVYFDTGGGAGTYTRIPPGTNWTKE